MSESPDTNEMPSVPLQEIQGFLREIVEHADQHSLNPVSDGIQSYPTADLIVRIPIKPGLSEYAQKRKGLIMQALIMGLAGKTCIGGDEKIVGDTIEFRSSFVRAEGGLEHFMANANGLLNAPEEQQRAFVGAFSREVKNLIWDQWDQPQSPLTIISDANLKHDKAAPEPAPGKTPRK